MRLGGIVLAFFILLSIGIVSAEKKICIDYDSPDSVSDINYELQDGTILISWNEALDTPACSGIDYYSIYLNDLFLKNTSYTFFELNETNEFEIKIQAVDFAGNVGDFSKLNVSFIEKKEPKSSGGGSSSSGSTTQYEENCSSWSECVDNLQFRSCSYGPYISNESRNCFVRNLSLENDSPSNTINSVEEIEKDKKESSGFSLITGQAISGALETAKKPTISVPIILGLFVLMFLIIRKKINRKK